MARARSVSIYQRPDSRIWYISYWVNGKRKRESTHTASKKAAQELARLREAQMTMGVVDEEYELARKLRQPESRERILDALHESPNVRVSISDAIEEYLQYSATTKRPKTVQNDRSRLNGLNHYLQRLSTSPRNVTDVLTGHVMDYLTLRQEEGLSSTTALRIREVTRAFFEFARKKKYVTLNPVDDVPRPKPVELTIEFLDPQQIEKCLDGLKGDCIEHLIATAIFAGLRREALTWLTWDDVDFERRLLHVRPKSVAGEYWKPKNGKSRVVPISRGLLNRIHRQRIATTSTVWVFPAPRGGRWHPDNLGARLRKLMQKAGLKWSFNHLRHTFGTMLAENGASDLKIAELMGNTPAVARRHYIRSLPETMHELVEFHAHCPRSDGADFATRTDANRI